MKKKIALLLLSLLCATAIGGATYYSAPMGPIVECYWSKSDIDSELDDYDILHYGGEDQNWVPITSSIGHFWYSIDTEPGSLNDWLDPKFRHETDWDLDVGLGNIESYTWSRPLLQTDPSDTWRVDVVSVSRLYQSTTAVAKSSPSTEIVEVTNWFWGPELPADKLWVIWNEPDSITVRGSNFHYPAWAYTYKPGCPIGLND